MLGPLKILNNSLVCPLCGKKTHYPLLSKKKLMETDPVCFECRYWEGLLANPPERMEVVGNVCYKVYPMCKDKDKSVILGGKGETRYFVRPDFSAFATNDVWKIGVIPERFIPRLQPTLVEISQKAYKKMQKNPLRCMARGCFDRYHCFRYDLSLERDGKPFNRIPVNWKVGNERCKFYIPFEEILSDYSSLFK